MHKGREEAYHVHQLYSSQSRAASGFPATQSSTAGQETSHLTTKISPRSGRRISGSSRRLCRRVWTDPRSSHSGIDNDPRYHRLGNTRWSVPGREVQVDSISTDKLFRILLFPLRFLSQPILQERDSETS